MNHTKPVIAVLVCLLALGGMPSLAKTCSVACPPPHSNTTCTVTCAGGCGVFCINGQCVGFCSGSVPSGPGQVLLLYEEFCVNAGELDFGDFAQYVSNVTGITINVNSNVTVTLDGSWSGTLEDVFDQVVAENGLVKTVVNSATWTISNQ